VGFNYLQDEHCAGSATDHPAIFCGATATPRNSLWRHYTSLLQSVAPPQEVTHGGCIVLSSFTINNGYLPSRLALIVNQSQLTRHSVRGGTSQFLYFMTTSGGGCLMFAGVSCLWFLPLLVQSPASLWDSRHWEFPVVCLCSVNLRQLLTAQWLL